ncbi:MAG: hypothetical protein LBC87_11630 [Fibromonadaceae bacterium]|jgi:uncharacterized protein (TIGR02145 family)|nr:hypothetical protein [Fibromonadaceae bacterium]
MNKTATLLLACTLLCVIACGQKNEQEKGTFTDTRDGKEYKTVKIGEQVWMAENLNYEVENGLCYGENGKVEKHIIIGETTLSDKEIQDNCNEYGRLYDWETAMEVCPDGWHLPSDEEWINLYSYVGGGETAGKYLKSKSGWINEFILYPFKSIMTILLAPLLADSFREILDFFKVIFSEFLKFSNGKDTFSFNALPSGYASDSGFGYYRFNGVYRSAYWWTSSLKNVEDGEDAYYHRMYSNEEDASNSYTGKGYFYSVRCLQGTSTGTKEPPNDPMCANIRADFAQQKGTFTDTRDSKEYGIVKIGEQVWMAENLNYKVKGSKCYSNKSANCCEYGRLYNWKTAMTVCPSGWHLPSNAEWDILYRHVEDGKSGKNTPYANYSETAGKFLKATSGWKDYEEKSGNGNDKFGFSALPGGYGHSDSKFRDVGYEGGWWSSSEDERENYFAYCHVIYYNGGKANSAKMFKNILYSVRCIQDTPAPPKGTAK